MSSELNDALKTAAAAGWEIKWVSEAAASFGVVLKHARLKHWASTELHAYVHTIAAKRATSPGARRKKYLQVRARAVPWPSFRIITLPRRRRIFALVPAGEPLQLYVSEDGGMKGWPALSQIEEALGVEPQKLKVWDPGRCPHCGQMLPTA